MAKNQGNAEQHLEDELKFFKNYSYSSSTISSKIIGHILKNKQKNKCVCIHEITRLIIMKIMMEMKNRSHRYDINRPRFRHRHRKSKYKMCLAMMMLICIKQHLSTIWSSIHEKVKQPWGWVEKKLCL